MPRMAQLKNGSSFRVQAKSSLRRSAGMEEYYLGVDVGATKSHAVIVDHGGKIAGFGQSGGGSPEVVGLEGFFGALQEICDLALSQARISIGQIAGAGLGVAGYDWPVQREGILDTIGNLGLDCPLALVNDALIALAVGASKGWGVAVIAGTSCNAWGLGPDGRCGRMAGSFHLGDVAGSREIVAESLIAVTKAWSARGPATALTAAYIDLVGAENEFDLIEGLALKRYIIGPSAAPIVFELARQGDKVAEELIKWAGQGLGDLALGVIRQLDLQNRNFEVILSGSFYRGSPVLQKEMEKIIFPVAPGANLMALTAPSVIGGVLLGMQKTGKSNERLVKVRQNLVQNFADCQFGSIGRI